VASSLAVKSVYASLSPIIASINADNIYEFMANAMQAAHLEINAKARTSLELMGMGTTLVVAVVRDNTAYIAHTGDSRCYLIRAHGPQDEQLLEGDVSTLEFSHPSGEGRLHRITNDHTMGDQLLINGILRENIPEKLFHSLTQSVGCGALPVPDFNSFELNRDDTLLLCSDGLTDMLSDNEIENIISIENYSLEVLANKLIETANANGGQDNVSVVLVRQSE
jgi:protein phosphatase